MKSRARVLVVDDDPDLLLLTSTVLSKGGYEVVKASTGRDALAAVRETDPDLVVLDVVLPDVSGAEVCKQIKADPKLRDTLVILLSGAMTSSEEQAVGLEAGADGYIVKPISNKELLARVHSMERIRRAEQKVRAASEELEATFNSITDLVSIHDTDFRVIKVNKAFCEALGKPPGELVGKKCHELMHGTREPWSVCPHRQAVGCSRPVTEEFWEPRLGKYLLVSCSPIVNEAGDVIGSAHTARDITLRRRAEEALKKAHDELEQRVLERTAELSSANVRLAEEIEERKSAEKALRESEAALRASQNDLRRLAGRILFAEEDERRRVARELHDDFTQRLAVLAIEAGKLESELSSSSGAAGKRIAGFREQMVRLSSDVHRLSRRLHPTILDDLGLVKAVEAECARFSQQEGIGVGFVGHHVSDTLSKETALALYRVVQEGLRNILKHAGTREARVALIGDEDRVHLSIEDDGAGFDPSTVRKKGGLGLASMEERVRLVGGRLMVESGQGRGTLITVDVPLTQMTSELK